MPVVRRACAPRKFATMSRHHSTPANPSVNMNQPPLIDRYRFWLANARSLADNTVEGYVGDVGRFLDSLDSTGADVYEMRPLLLGDYVFHLSKAGKRRSTLKRNIAAVRSFYRFLTSADGRFRKSPMPDARDYPMKAEERDPRWIGPAEAERLMDAADDTTPCGLRDRALLELLYASGVRLAEAHGMNTGDIDRLGGDILVRGKGGKEREVLYGADADRALHRYLVHGRPALLVDPDQPALWLDRYGGRLSQRAIATVVRCYADKAGLSSGVHPHVIRHSFATAMLEGGADLRVIQYLPGHSSVATTQIYAHVTKKEARAAYLEHHPLANRTRPRCIIGADRTALGSSLAFRVSDPQLGVFLTLADTQEVSGSSPLPPTISLNSDALAPLFRLGLPAVVGRPVPTRSERMEMRPQMLPS